MGRKGKAGRGLRGVPLAGIRGSAPRTPYRARLRRAASRNPAAAFQAASASTKFGKSSNTHLFFVSGCLHNSSWFLNCMWSRRALRRSPFSYSRSGLPALRWRSGHRSDQSPLRGRTPQTVMQPVTVDSERGCPLSELIPPEPTHSYHLLRYPYSSDISNTERWCRDARPTPISSLRGNHGQPSGPGGKPESCRSIRLTPWDLSRAIIGRKAPCRAVLLTVDGHVTRNRQPEGAKYHAPFHVTVPSVLSC